MKVTIIISCHKDSPYLTESIESALKQDFDDYEVILSSDGWEGCKGYAKKYGIEYCLSDKMNHSHAFNNTLRIVKGEWVKDQHYDDIMLPNCLKDLWEGRDGSITYGNAGNFWPGGKITVYKPPSRMSILSFWPPLKSPLHAAAFIFKAEDHIKLGGRDEDLHNSEEVDYFIKVCKAGLEFKYVDSLVCYYRRHEQQKCVQLLDNDYREPIRQYFLKKHSDLV